MTKEEILSMEAGPEIDALFHKLVMNECLHPKEHAQYESGSSEPGYEFREDWHCGLCGEWFDYNPEDCPEFIPKYSTNISHAMEGVEKVQERYQVVFRWFCFSQKWECALKGAFKWKPFCLAEAETASLAITRALILWAMEKEATNVK